MGRIRVLVAEDSLTIRKRFVEILGRDPEVEVVGEAENGKDCIELCRDLKPDVVSLDMVMPVMSGLAATEYIMAYCPTPILIVSASLNRGESWKTYDALAAGALDVMDKPKCDGLEDGWGHAFISRVKLLSRIKVVTHLRGRRRNVSHPDHEASTRPSKEPSPYKLLAIGTSTGGPAAVAEVLRNLPANFPLPILLVIHIGPAFAESLAEWLNSQSPIPVTYARDGELLPAIGTGRVIMAPPDRHLKLVHGRLRVTLDPERHCCRPSVDVLFESLAQEEGRCTIAGLLTGMGRDGAEGLLALRKAGALTLAQDELTSVVFGMPKEAIRIGAAERVLAVDEIAPTLIALTEN